MSVIEQMGYALRCDFPGCDVKTGDLGEYAFYGDLSYAVEEWEEHGGVVTDDGAYCETHTVIVWTADDYGEFDDGERAPMPYTIENLFALANARIRDQIDRREYWALARHGDRCRRMAANQSRAERILFESWIRGRGVPAQMVNAVVIGEARERGRGVPAMEYVGLGLLDRM